MNRHSSDQLMRQRGATLIELMVSMVIGLFVVAAVLVMYLGSGSTSTLQTQVSQMTEDAQIGFAQLSRDIQMAGYSEANGKVVGAGGTATFVRPAIARPVFGCTTAFTDVIGPVDTVTAATCSVAGNPGIQVTYQATSLTSVLSAAGVPVDCQGNAITVTADATFGNIYLTSNRYFVSGTDLHCASQSAAASLPIVQDVQAMQVWYGIATDWAEGMLATRTPRYYVLATPPAPDWTKVVSVRICLLMRTAEPVFTTDDVNAGLAAYTDCDGTAATSADRRMYRAFFTTVALRNKIGY